MSPCPAAFFLFFVFAMCMKNDATTLSVQHPCVSQQKNGENTAERQARKAAPHVSDPFECAAVTFLTTFDSHPSFIPPPSPPPVEFRICLFLLFKEVTFPGLRNTTGTNSKVAQHIAAAPYTVSSQYRMSSTYNTIVSRVQEAFKPSELEVTVISESEAKYNVRIVSAAFAGVPLIQRHRMVNALFEEELRSGSIHALTISAKPPA
jgi:BolA-like protein 1